MSQGKSPRLEILLEVDDSEWAYWEIEMIKLFRDSGCDLVNGTDGGDCPGALGHMKGKKRNPEVVKAVAQKLVGTKRTPEQRARMSEARRKVPPRTFSKEARENIRQAQLAYRIRQKGLNE